MDNEETKNLIQTMDYAVEHIDKIDCFLMVLGMRDNNFILTFNGNTDDMQAMMRATLDHLSDDFDVVDFSQFLVDFNSFARRLMEHKFSSDSEQEDK